MSQQSDPQPTPLKPSERQWMVTTAVRLPDGNVVPATRAMEEAMLELAPILTRCGGIASIATRRVEVGGEMITSSIVVRWQTFSPVEQDGEIELPLAEAPADAQPGPVEPQAA